MPVKNMITVFISSTIKECSAERKIAKEAVDSLNHQPLLFEGLGATPHPPRSEYLRLLREADIFVGIYRESYGSLTPGMSISGIEDEFIEASQRGLPLLLYVLSEPVSRDERLVRLIETMMTSKRPPTVGFYKQSDELLERLRADIASVVADHFYGPHMLAVAALPRPEEVLLSLLPKGVNILPREHLKTQLLNQVKRHSVLQVFGGGGVGKSVLLASLAIDGDFVFVEVAGLSELEIVGAISNALAHRLGQPVEHLFDEEAALKSLLARWNSMSGMVVIVDGLQDEDAIARLFSRLEKRGSDNTIVYSVRSSVSRGDHAAFEVPVLSELEVTEFLTSQFGARIAGATATDAWRLSRGVFLYLRYYEPGSQASADIATLELRSWKLLNVYARELVMMLAIAERPLALADILSVLGFESPEGRLSDALDEARLFIREDLVGYSIAHEHLRTTLAGYLEEHPQRHLFYANRLARRYMEVGDATAAFLALADANDPAAIELSSEAMFDSSRRWDLTRLRRILRFRLQWVRDAGDASGEGQILLALAQCEQRSGRLDAAREAFIGALASAERAGDDALRSLVLEETKLVEAYSTLRPEVVDELTAIRDSYDQAESPWSVARLSLELSALWLRLNQFSKAETEASLSLDFFERIGEEHGAGLARRNLATALSSLPGQEERVEELLRRLSEEGEETNNLRHRAWLANVLCRRLRSEGMTDRAKEKAKQAIDLARELGDVGLVALNTVNLGNVARDAGDLVEAQRLYLEASEKARSVGDLGTEASAIRLAATASNARGDHVSAKMYGQHARALLRGSIYLEEVVRACEEIANAENGLREPTAAVEAFLEGANIIRHVDPDERARLGLEAIRALPDRDDPAAFGDLLGRLFGADVRSMEELLGLFPLMITEFPEQRIVGLMNVFARHIFEGGAVPPPLSARLLVVIAEKATPLLRDPAVVNRALLAFMPLLASANLESRHLSLIVNLAELVAGNVDGVYFKPYADGAANWTLRLELNPPVILSIRQVDDRVETAVAAMILAVFMKGFERDLQAEIFGRVKVVRQEIAVMISNQEELAERGIAIPGLDARMSEPVSSSRPTRPEDDEQVPTMVICRSDIARTWRPDFPGGAFGLQKLLVSVASEVAFQLVKGKVDLDELIPKVASVVRRTL